MPSLVVIPSKGRPQCRTASLCKENSLPFIILCGDDDEALPEYRELWGDRVLVFDWYEQVKVTDPMDGFGFDTMASGACPVRNATAEISRRRGERRHWQLDDDYTGFYGLNAEGTKNVRLDGAELHRRMELIAGHADRCGLGNCGFPPSTREVVPDHALTFGRRVFNAHNLPSGGELFEPWVARMNDDLINAINSWRHGRPEYSVRFMEMAMPATQSEDGGLSELYRDEGTVRKTAYAVMACPAAVKLIQKFGRYHHRANWQRIAPKLVSDGYARA